MITYIIQALFKNRINSHQYVWASKETTKNLWLALRRNQAKVSLFTVYKEKKKIYRKM